MSDVFDYLAWRGDLTFSVAEQNEADALIFCMLSFMDFADIVSESIGEREVTIKQAVTRYFEKYPNGNFVPSRLIPQNMRRFSALLANSRRFGEVSLSGYCTKILKGNEPDSQMQFAALSARTERGLMVIYRGTDDTLVGWKENFNSDLVYPIPAQRLAADYLERAARTGLPLTVMGHSKGGNLAVYAAASTAFSADRILSVLDFDGPGFPRSFFDLPRYGAIREKITKYLPEYAIIGLIRESDCQKRIVKCRGKGLKQHNGFHWQYTHRGLQQTGRLDPGAVLLNTRLKRCYGMLPSEERQKFIEGVYHLASKGGRETLTELTNERGKLLKDFRGLEQEQRKILKTVVAQILRQLLLDQEKHTAKK